MKKSNTKELVKLIVSTIVIGILLLYIIMQLFLPDTTVKVFGFKPYVVITESMVPVIEVNDVVVVHRFDLEDAEVGDIITFRADIDYNGEKEVVTHYIYSITGTGNDTIIRTNRYYENMSVAVPDTWLLSEEDILGSYWFQIPKIGYVSEFVKSPFGIAAMVVNVGIIVGIVVLIKKSKPQVEEKAE